MDDYFLDVENESAEYNQLLLDRWQEGLERSKTRLRDEDRAIADTLGTPEAFLDYLTKKTKGGKYSMAIPDSHSADTHYQGYSWVFGTISSAAFHTGNFHWVHNLLGSLFSGYTAYSRQLCLQTEERFQHMLEIQKSLRRTLLKISRLAGRLGDFGDDEEFKEAFVEIYVALVDFWVESIAEVRNYPYGVAIKDTEQPWKSIRLTLNKTLANIEGRYTAIQDLADQAFGIPVEKALSKISLQQRVNITADSKSRIFVLPLPENTQFLGRNQLLTRMHEHLRPENRGSNLHCFTIFGLGGVGKTQTVAAYAYKYAGRRGETSEYDAVLWVDSESEDAMRESFTEIARALGRHGITEAADPKQIRREVLNWLTDTDQEWLLIYVDVNSWDTVMKYWPPGPSKGAIIITSRDFSLASRPASAGKELLTLDARESDLLFRSLLEFFDGNDDKEKKCL